MIFKKMTPIKFDISLYTEQQLCQIYNNLNSWQWDCLLGEKPEMWDEIPCYSNSLIKKHFIVTKHKMIAHIMNSIQENVGQRALLKYHWVNKLSRTEDEFSRWFNLEIENHVFGVMY